MVAQTSSERRDDRSALSSAKVGTPEKGLTVERLTHEEIPEICSLYRRVWETFKPELPPELLKSWQPTVLEFTSWMEGVTYFFARREGKMIGAIGCEITDGSCRLIHLAVDPEARRAGVASELTQAAIDWAKHNAVRSVWADALSRFGGAAELFRKMGFTECGTLHRHYWNEDVRLFEKLL